MAEKLKNKVTDEELKIRATSDEKITVKLTNNYAFQKIFKNAKIVKGFLMALLNLKEYEIKKIEITDPFTLGENNEEKEGILDIKLVFKPKQKKSILKCKIHIRMIGQNEAFSTIAECLPMVFKKVIPTENSHLVSM